MERKKRSDRRNRPRSFLEPRGWFERLAYMYLAAWIPSMIFKGLIQKDDVLLITLLLWWIVTVYYSITFMFRITRVLYYLFRR